MDRHDLSQRGICNKAIHLARRCRGSRSILRRAIAIVFFGHPGGDFPQGRGAAFDRRPAARRDLFERDRAFHPGAAVGRGVVQHRLEAIQGLGEFRVVAFGGLELQPQFAELAGLRLRQQAKDALGGEAFALGLAGMGRRDVERHIAGIDLDDVVDQQHFDDARHVDRTGRVLGEHQRIDGEMP